MPSLMGFVGGAYLARSKNFDSQRCINLYLEMGSGSSKSPAVLYGTPGLRTVLDLAGNGFPIRGMFVFNPQILFVVIGPNVYKITAPSLTTTLIGTITTTGTRVYMESNGIGIFLSAGGLGYEIDPVAETVTLLSLPSACGMVGFLDGMFLYNEPGSGRFWGSDLYSFTVDPLSFATAEGSPDNVIGSIVDHREYWLFGSRTTEVWFNNGNTVGFPYSRLDGAFMQVGCLAANSIARADNSVFWLSADENGQGMVMRATGFKPERISTHAIERTIAEMPSAEDATAFVYQQEGHTFYQINFSLGNKTFVYDMSTGMWHERAYRAEDGTFDRHRANNMVYFANKILVGDWNRGRIYQYDLDYFTDAGNPIIRRRASNFIAQENLRFAHTALTVEMERGTGILEGQGSNPQAMLRWSDDHGHTWGNERWKTFGRTGKYGPRVRWTRLGESRDRVYELTISDPVKVAIIGAYLNE